MDTTDPPPWGWQQWEPTQRGTGTGTGVSPGTLAEPPVPFLTEAVCSRQGLCTSSSGRVVLGLCSAPCTTCTCAHTHTHTHSLLHGALVVSGVRTHALTLQIKLCFLKKPPTCSVHISMQDSPRLRPQSPQRGCSLPGC